ncbi:hypothetical protein [Massilia sp. Se16.2.3]|uniref:hypothetical protein n=1 Tax=Massilia sp. Se16.2.3 TaxID=2709303 RepID=UPI001E38A060|nr:hypothetical protein [Massilia sp. Se16.2.3]
MQVLDQQVAPPRRVAKQGLHFDERLRVDTAALGRLALALAAGAADRDRDDGVVHGQVVAGTLSLAAPQARAAMPKAISLT